MPQVPERRSRRACHCENTGGADGLSFLATQPWAAKARTQRTPTRYIAILSAFAILLASGAAAAARRRPGDDNASGDALAKPLAKESASKEDQWHATFHLEKGHISNVRYANDPLRIEGAWFNDYRGEVSWRNLRERPLPRELRLRVRAKFFPEFSDRDFIEIKPQIHQRFGRTEAILGYVYIPRRLKREGEAGVDGAYFSRHAVDLTVQRKFGKGKPLLVRVRTEAQWDDYRSNVDERDSFTPEISGMMRMRYSPLFVPRVKLSYGVRDAKRDNYNRQEVSFAAGVDSRVSERLVLRFRFRKDWRNYSVPGRFDYANGVKNKDFGRDDEAEQYEVRMEAKLPCFDSLLLTARYRYKDGDSTLPNRDYIVNEFVLGFTYLFSVGS